MKIFSLIVARAGSKGFKNKNIRKIGDKTVFEYTLDYSLKLNEMIDGEVFTIVSSDSEIIQEHCEKNNIRFDLRIPELAQSSTPIEDVIYYVYNKIGEKFDLISLLPANVVTRYPEEFIKAYNFLKEKQEYDCVISMQNVEKFNPLEMLELNNDILPKQKMTAFMRQDLQQYMLSDGHTILFRPDHFLNFMRSKKKVEYIFEAFGKKVKPMINEKFIIDIDTARDFEIASAFIQYKEKL